MVRRASRRKRARRSPANTHASRSLRVAPQHDRLSTTAIGRMPRARSEPGREARSYREQVSGEKWRRDDAALEMATIAMTAPRRQRCAPETGRTQCRATSSVSCYGDTQMRVARRAYAPSAGVISMNCGPAPHGVCGR
jgi:hypothetical protein